MSSASTPTFTERHVALARAAVAAIAAVMITFTGDHSAAVGLSVFSGFAVATGLVWALSAWLVYPSGQRIPAILLAVVSVIAGIAAGTVFRGPVLLSVLIISWALISGIIELVWGLRDRRVPERRGNARDEITLGAITLVLGIAALFINVGFELPYYIKDAGQEFTLTGVTILVGVFGGYAAIVAVHQAILGFSPARPALSAEPAATAVTGKADND
ncbi:acyl-CoA synthetase [Microbacterium nymphoidis]|uniref:acyl-CoA synthetase n=1 Tax=Microbacterium nymphoidis TaxID=2898586 RepID=UPI001E65463C|nr:acyl-CoA synthetase [Microbacterium nymphoidis]MCD2499915.1 acyl-CoA synthetase [Microbacterium nymphoidis]